MPRPSKESAPKSLPNSRRMLVSIFVRPLLRVFMFAVGYSLHVFFANLGVRFWWVEEKYVHRGKRESAGARVVVAQHVSGPWDGVYLIWRTSGIVIAEESSFDYPLGRAFAQVCALRIISDMSL